MLSCTQPHVVSNLMTLSSVELKKKDSFSHHSLSFYETRCHESEWRLMLRVPNNTPKHLPFSITEYITTWRRGNYIIISVLQRFMQKLVCQYHANSSQQFTDLSSVSFIVWYPFSFPGKKDVIYQRFSSETFKFRLFRSLPQTTLEKRFINLRVAIMRKTGVESQSVWRIDLIPALILIASYLGNCVFTKCLITNRSQNWTLCSQDTVWAPENVLCSI